MEIKTLVPQHISSAIKQIKADIKEKNYYGTVTEFLQLEEEIRNVSQLMPKYAYPKIFSILGKILDLAEQVEVSGGRIYLVDIDKKLALALNQAMNIHPSMRKEISTVISVLANPLHSGFTQSEDYFDFKNYNLVTSERAWKKIMTNPNAEVLCPSFKHLLVGMVCEKRDTASLPVSLLDMYHTIDGNEEVMFKRWFMMGITLTIYIYVPK